MSEERCRDCSRSLIKIFTPGGFLDCEVCARDKTIAERDAEIERLKADNDNWFERYNDLNDDLFEKLQAHEKREAALLAFVEADDLLQSLLGDEEIGMTASEWESLQASIRQAMSEKKEAREQLRSVIDGK